MPPPKTPTAILKMRGSWLADKRGNEPEPERTRPRCPRWLAKEARRAWRELIPQLETMSILGRCDRNALTRYCQLWARWRATEEWLAEHGDIITMRNEAGQLTDLKQVPQVGRSLRLSAELLKLERQFGMTPSARAGLAIPKNNPQENRGKNRFFASPPAG